jgi:AcrR family transcriptional regulator
MNTRKPVVETTKEAMLRVAIAAIDDGGEDGIRLDAILQEVGVSPSSLYYHYGNLTGLVEAAQVERFRRANLNNAIEVRQRIELVESVDEFKKLVDLLIKNTGAFLVCSGPTLWGVPLDVQSYCNSWESPKPRR